MNWKRLKEKFPNAYPEIVAFNEKWNSKRTYRCDMINCYCESKGKKARPMFIYALREIEKELANTNQIK